MSIILYLQAVYKIFIYQNWTFIYFYVIIIPLNSSRNGNIVQKEGIKPMKARFEGRSFNDTVHTSAHKYKNLQNLPHWHMEYELVYVFEGTAEVMINNNLFELSKGMSVFVHSKDVHYMKAPGESIIGVIKTDADLVKSIAKHKRLASPVLQNTIDTKHYFEEILTEFKEGKALCEIVADTIISRLVAEVFRTGETIEENSTYIKNTNKHKELLEMLSENFAHITFDKAAEFMNLNKSYFSRYFYRFSGMTFTHYLNTLKVSAAAEKIAEGKMSMTEISIACGFGTIRNFNRVFKELTGYSPKKLPDNYIFVSGLKTEASSSFNPTLNCTEIAE